jgi:hypothetical protein
VGNHQSGTLIDSPDLAIKNADTIVAGKGVGVLMMFGHDVLPFISVDISKLM